MYCLLGTQASFQVVWRFTAGPQWRSSPELAWEERHAMSPADAPSVYREGP